MAIYLNVYVMRSSAVAMGFPLNISPMALFFQGWYYLILAKKKKKNSDHVTFLTWPMVQLKLNMYCLKTTNIK